MSRKGVLGACLLLLAGCLDNDPVTGPEGAAAADPKVLPDDILEGGSVSASVYNSLDVCGENHDCFDYPFLVGNLTDNVTTTVHMDAIATWGLPSSEFDLILYRGTEELDADYTSPPRTSANLAGDLEEGEYTVTIDAYAVVQDDFVIEIRFSPSTA